MFGRPLFCGITARRDELCVCVCMCVCAYVHVYVYNYVCVYMYMCCMFVCGAVSLGAWPLIAVFLLQNLLLTLLLARLTLRASSFP